MAAVQSEEKAIAQNKTYIVLKGGCVDDEVVDIEDLYGMDTAQKCLNCDARESKMYYFPFRRNLKKGETYEYCRCGRSETFPFCDDSHTVDDVKNHMGPIRFKMIKKQSIHMLCGCRLSESLPFCDGSHAFISHSDKSVKPKPQNKL